MPTPWTMVDAAFPTFTGEEKVKEQVTKLFWATSSPKVWRMPRMRQTK